MKSQRNPEASLKLEITMLCLAAGQSSLPALAFQGGTGTNSCFQLMKMEEAAKPGGGGGVCCGMVGSPGNSAAGVVSAIPGIKGWRQIRIWNHINDTEINH